MEKTEKVFVQGSFIKDPHPNAPEFVLLNISYNKAPFIKWLQEQPDVKGWVTTTVKRSPKGTIYAELDMWKPKQAVDDETGEVIPDNLDSIPTYAEQQKNEQDLSEIPF